MSMDAEVHFWYGVNLEDLGYDDSDFAVEAFKTKLGDDYRIEHEGVEITLLDCGESSDPHGIGARLVSHSWNDKVARWTAVTELVEFERGRVKNAVDSLLEELAIPGPRSIYMHTRYW